MELEVRATASAALIPSTTIRSTVCRIAERNPVRAGAAQPGDSPRRRAITTVGAIIDGIRRPASVR